MTRNKDIFPSRTLREVCATISSGGTPSRKEPRYFSSNGQGHLWVKSKELLDVGIAETEERITDDGLASSAARYYPTQSVLMAMYGANVGQLGFLRRKATVNQAICGMVVNEKVADWRYVFYALLHRRSSLVSQAFGAAQQNLNQDIIRGFAIPVPPLPVQRKIAAILSAYDDLIENNTRRIRILEEMAQAIYREWFVNLRFPGHQKARMVDSPMGKIPEGWEAVTLGDLCGEVRRGIQPGEADAETPYFGLEHLPRKSIALSDWGKAKDVQSTKLAFKKGEILFGKIRPYFHKVGVAPVDGMCSSDAIVIVPKSAGVFGVVLSCVSSEPFVAHATRTSQGTKMPRANWDVLVQYPMALPPKPLLGQFNDLVADVVRQIQNMIFRIRNLRQTRDLLLPKLISGEVDVSELDIKTGVNGG
jgi:type I restriction enzyme S subunit